MFVTVKVSLSAAHGSLRAVLSLRMRQTTAAGHLVQFGSNSQKSSKKSRGKIVEKNEKVLLWKVKDERATPVKEAAAENA